jgi:hypothetical protein
MATILFPQVIRDWFMGLRSKSPRSETQGAAERAATQEPSGPDTQAPSGEEIVRQAAQNNDSSSRE